MLSKHDSKFFIIANFHPMLPPIVVSELYCIMQTPRIWATNYLSKLSETPIAIHWQGIVESSLEFLLMIYILDVPLPSNVHQESKPQLHPTTHEIQKRNQHTN